MILGTIFLIILYLILKYTIAWITYYNNLDPRLGDSTWRFTYDYPVIGERDISDLDDKDFVRLRRKKNKIVFALTHNYSAYPMLREAKDLVSNNKIGKTIKSNCRVFKTT